MSRILRPLVSSAISACADRRFMSSQIACSRGASAECPSDMPSASPTTWDVAAVPRNWQPPPGDAQARQPRSAASCSEISLCTNRTPMVCTRAASSPSTGSRSPPGTRTQGRSRLDAGAIIIAEGGLVACRHTEHTAAGRRRSDQPAENRRRIVAMRKAVEHRRRALRAAVARIRARGGERDRARLFELASRRFHRQPDFPVVRCGIRARRVCRRARGCRRGWTESETPGRRAREGSTPCRHSGSSRTGRRMAAPAASLA